ncbi:hypothetical protein ACJX0J_005418 [Zea mays]
MYSNNIGFQFVWASHFLAEVLGIPQDYILAILNFEDSTWQSVSPECYSNIFDEWIHLEEYLTQYLAIWLLHYLYTWFYILAAGIIAIAGTRGAMQGNGTVPIRYGGMHAMQAWTRRYRLRLHISICHMHAAGRCQEEAAIIYNTVPKNVGLSYMH